MIERSVGMNVFKLFSFLWKSQKVDIQTDIDHIEIDYDHYNLADEIAETLFINFCQTHRIKWEKISQYYYRVPMLEFEFAVSEKLNEVIPELLTKEFLERVI